MDRNQDRQGLASQRRRAVLRAIGGTAGMAGAAIVAGSGLVAAASARGTPAGPDASNARAAIRPFRAALPQSALDDLKQRLARTCWPDAETSGDWRQGVPLATARSLAAYWRDHYDWRRFERRLNAFPQFRTEIDGLGIHFLHVHSRHANALPLLLTHGWPGSIVEFLKIIPMLTDPVAHGGKAEDAFHVVIPSLPGFGFSDKPRDAGWNLMRTGKAWAALMARLGYAKWVAQGGDWGAGVTTVLGHLQPPGLAGIHLNWQFVFPEKMPTAASPAASCRCRWPLRCSRTRSTARPRAGRGKPIRTWCTGTK